MKELLLYAVKIQTKLGDLFDFITVDEEINNQIFLDALGFTKENIDALNEMERRISEMERGKSFYQPIFKSGYLTLCQNEWYIKKKVELLLKFKEGKIQSLQDMKQAQKELDYDAELDLRIVHDDRNNTFKDDFNKFYYQVQNGEFPLDDIFYTPKDITDIGDFFEILINALVKKNKVNGNIIPLLRYATYKKQTDLKFQLNVRNLIDTNSKRGLKLVKKYQNLFKCEIPQIYERMKVNQYQYAVDGFSVVEDLDQKNLELINGPFIKQINEDMKNNFVYNKIIEQNQQTKDSQEYCNFLNNPLISDKFSPVDLESHMNELSYNISDETNLVNENDNENQYYNIEEKQIDQDLQKEIQAKYDLINKKITPQQYEKQLPKDQINDQDKLYKKKNFIKQSQKQTKYSFQDQNQIKDDDLDDIDNNDKYNKNEQRLNDKDLNNKQVQEKQKKNIYNKNKNTNKSTIKFEDNIDDD